LPGPCYGGGTVPYIVMFMFLMVLTMVAACVV
jgi:hypothetical protein